MKIKNIKIKNFLLPALAIAIFAAPIMAQSYDYHDNEEIVNDSLNKDIYDKHYLDLDLLRIQIDEDHSLDPKLIQKTKNSIAAKKISKQEQYNLMKECIINNRADVLASLIEGGFDPEIDMKLNLTTLPAIAFQYKDLEAFKLTLAIPFTLSMFDTERYEKILNDVKGMQKTSTDSSLEKRLQEYVYKAFDIEPVEDEVASNTAGSNK